MIQGLGLRIWGLGFVFFGTSYLESQRGGVCILINPINHIMAPVVPIISLLMKSPRLSRWG